MMKNCFINLTDKDRIYLFILLLLGSSLFYLGYQYIHHINQPAEVLREQPVKPVVLPTNEYNPADSLLEIKLGRDRDRSRELERVQNLLEQIGLSDEVRKEAERELWRLTQSISKENELESMLKANGFKECLVTIGQKTITVVVSGKLNPEEAKAVGQVTTEVSGFGYDQIRIVEQLIP